MLAMKMPHIYVKLHWLNGTLEMIVIDTFFSIHLAKVFIYIILQMGFNDEN